MEKISKFLIYSLVDPISGEIRYIGRSCKGLRRARASAKEHFGHKGNWIKKLESQGLNPKIVIIEECSSKDEVIEIEMFYISYYRFLGANLTNLTKGGLDQTPFPSGKVRMAGIIKLSHSDPEYKARCSLQFKEYWSTRRPAFIKAIVAIKDGIELHFDAIVDAEKALKVHHANICSVLKGKRKRAGGYFFKYV